jgi:hypothetical protein
MDGDGQRRHVVVQMPFMWISSGREKRDGLGMIYERKTIVD